MATQDTASPRTSREVLNERLRSLTYAVDHTGENPANHVVETRTLTDANRSDYNHIIPKAAPFFAHTVRIFHTQTNDELINGQDFYCVGTFVKAITNVLHHREICWAIIFDDRRISGEYRIEYQTVGGEFVLDQQEMAEILANFVENPRTVDWEQVVGRPLTFPPLPHDIEVNNLVGFNEQVDATHGVEEAIRALLRDEEQDHPGYGQVITELFRQQQRQDRFQETIDNLRLTNSQSQAALGENLSNEINRVERESKERDTALESKVNNVIQTKITEMDTSYKAADVEIRKELARAKTDLTNSLNAKDTALRTLIDEKDTAQTRARTTAINGVNTSITNLGRDVRAEFKAADKVLDNKIEALRVSTTQATATALGEAKTYTNTEIAALRNALTAQGTQSSTDLSGLQRVVNANKKTSDDAEAALRTSVTNEARDRVAAVTDLNNKITTLTSSLNTKESALSNRINQTNTNLTTTNNNLTALGQRLDANFVTFGKEEKITGIKTFKGEIRVEHSTDATKYLRLGFNSTDIFLHNPITNKYFTLKNAGDVMYDGKRLLNTDDLATLNNKHNTVNTALGNYVTLGTDQTINSVKRFRKDQTDGNVDVMFFQRNAEVLNIRNAGSGWQFYYSAGDANGSRGSANPYFTISKAGNIMSGTLNEGFVQSGVVSNDGNRFAKVLFDDTSPAVGFRHGGHTSYLRVFPVDGRTPENDKAPNVTGIGKYAGDFAMIKGDQEFIGEKFFTHGNGLWVKHANNRVRLNANGDNAYIEATFGAETDKPTIQLHKASSNKAPTLAHGGTFSSDFAMLAGNQKFTGTKTFKYELQLEHQTDATKTARIGFNSENIFIYNPVSNKYLTLKNNDSITYDGKRILTTDDLTAVNNKIGEYVTLATNQNIESLKTFIRNADSGNVTLMNWKRNGERLALFHNNYSWVFHYAEGVEGKGRDAFNPHFTLNKEGLRAYGVRTAGDFNVGVSDNGAADVQRGAWIGQDDISGYICFKRANDSTPIMRIYSTAENKAPNLARGGSYSGDFIMSAGEQNITGYKKFKTNLGIIHSTDNTKIARIGFNATDLWIHNPISNKYLQIKNDGELNYSGKRILTIDDLNTLTTNLTNNVNTINTSLNGYVKLTTNQNIAGSKKFTDVNGVWVEHSDKSTRINHDSTSGYFQVIYGNGDSPHMRIYPSGQNRPPRLESAGSVTGEYVMANGPEQQINGVKSFKQWIRVRRADTDEKYSEWSYEPNNIFRYWADGRNRMWIDQDGRFFAPRGLSIGINNNVNDDGQQRWSHFSVNHHDADPYISLTGGGSGNADCDRNYGRLNVQDLYVRSDIRLKENIVKIENATEKLEKINGYTYNLKGSISRAGGVIAQEVIDVLPDVVHTRQDDEEGEEFYSVQYNGVIALLVEALKESNEREKALEERIARLEEKLNV